ncbi:hypothetical protein [Streptomyces sp. NPDC059928]|uniref:hypothetical protein n=1 Tax=unclassified Streptomyces TaxID=2593676 RepID=UPI00364C59D5
MLSTWCGGIAPADQRWNLPSRDTCGSLWQHEGTGDPAAPLADRTKVGSGWGIYNAITSLSSQRADGIGDLVARDRDGLLWHYPATGNAKGPFSGRIKVGGGWGVYNSLVGTGDLTIDGRPDLVARDKTGQLWLYSGTGERESAVQRHSGRRPLA